MKKSDIPNLLTVIRMLFVFVLIALMLLDYHLKILGSQLFLDVRLIDLLVTLIFLVASFTDFLDGYLARRFKVVSTFGKLMDPLADKLLVNSALILLAFNGSIHAIFPLIMISRDILVDGLRMLALEQSIVISASLLGKFKTVTQMLAITVALLGIFRLDFVIVTVILMSVCSLVSIVSGINYYVMTFKLLKNDKTA